MSAQVPEPRLHVSDELRADARLALDLLLCEEEGTALTLAQSIDSLNQERQRMTQEAQELARETGQSVNRTAQSIVERTLNIPPRITLKAGTPVTIQLAENLVLPSLGNP